MFNKLKNISFLLLIFISNKSLGQLVKRLNGETAGQFAIRIKPDNSQIAHQAIETNNWKPFGNTVLVFYSKSTTYSYESPPDTLTGQIIFGYALIEKSKQLYEKILIDSFDIDVKINSVFFANADADNDKELCILTSDIPPSEKCKCDGVYYQTKIYDKPVLNQTRLTYLTNISSKFIEFEGLARLDTVEEKATFKTAQAVRQELLKLRRKN